MKYPVRLDFTVPFGDLAPHFDALKDGKALASCCSKCGRVAFPARATCGSCGSRDLSWKQLNGNAQVVFRTEGRTHSYALVKFEGADTLSTVGLIDPERQTSYGTLVESASDMPGLWLALAEESGGDKDED